MKNLKWIIIFALAGAASLTGIILMRFSPEAPIAELRQNGRLIKTVALDKNAPAYEFCVRSKNGGENIICIKDGKIYVASASCPDKICVSHGPARPGSPIICLPNRLSVTLCGRNKEIDAVSGGE